MSARLNHDILHRKLLPSRPSDKRLRDFDVLPIWERDRQRERFPWSHRQVTRDPPVGAREVQDGTLPLDWSSVVRDGALHRKATAGSNREGNGSLAGRCILCSRDSLETTGTISWGTISWCMAQD